MFFNKTKHIELNCYTDRADVYNYFPITKANKILPAWYKKLPVPKSGKNIKPGITFDEYDKLYVEPNLKDCVAFSNYISNSFVVPLWSDLFLEIAEEGEDFYRWQYSDGCSSLKVHKEEETGIPSKEYQHLKLDSPWVFKCSENINFLASPPTWFFKELHPLIILSGVMEFKINSATHINMFIKRLKDKQSIILEAGTPIYNFTALTDKKIILNKHLVSKETFANIHKTNARISFTKHYRKKQKIIEKTKCPFKFDVES